MYIDEPFYRSKYNSLYPAFDKNQGAAENGEAHQR